MHKWEQYIIADVGTKQVMQEMGALHTRLPPLLAHKTTNGGMLKDSGGRGSTDEARHHDGGL